MLLWLTTRRLAGWQRAVGLGAAGLALVLSGVRLVQPAVLGDAGLVAASALSHATIYLSLLTVFGLSLAPGHTPLITAFATRLRGPLTPAMVRYTKSVTEAWCGYFALQLVTSAVLLGFAPAAVWSAFANLLDVPLLVAMFGAEYAVRRLRFPGTHHISPIETARRFSAADAATGGR